MTEEEFFETDGEGSQKKFDNAFRIVRYYTHLMTEKKVQLSEAHLRILKSATNYLEKYLQG